MINAYMPVERHAEHRIRIANIIVNIIMKV
jgi:hypothetical protein